MELRRRLNPRIILIGLYFVCFVAYIVYGLQPAEAVQYDVDAKLSIPSISLDTDVAVVSLNDQKLETPDTIAGSFSGGVNKTLLIGHSTTVFTDLKNVELGDFVYYKDKTYKIIKLELKEKPSVDMSEVLKREDKDTIVIMTCAGKLLSGGDATHRFMVTAVAVD